MILGNRRWRGSQDSQVRIYMNKVNSCKQEKEIYKKKLLPHEARWMHDE